MILETVKVLDIKRVGDMDEGVQAGIDEGSYPFIFELVSKQLYSNPIGSVIREITSNCFDSHIEAGVDEPVIISKTYSIEEGYAIEFKDVGIGMSPDRIYGIYMNYFSSTKRQDNTQIGGFGIGSKTPLAYCELFYVTTIYDGLEYEYIFHKGENKPTLESLLGYYEVEEEYETRVKDEEGNTLLDENLEEMWETRTRVKKIPIGNPTEEHNGTIIKINIDGTKRSYTEEDDMTKFTRELKFQLAYFDSVYFKSWGISNEYDIYEGKYFKFRSDIDQNHTEIHLCIGKVRYHIDFTKVNVPHAYRKIPIAVKFEIGELKITPSRETLRYDNEGIKLILDRVNLAANEIIGLFEAQNPEVDNLADYIKLSKEVARIVFNLDKEHYMYLWASSGLSKNYRFKPLSELAIKKTPSNMFFMWEIKGSINRGTYIPVKYDPIDVTNQIISEGNYVILNKEDRMSGYTNIYIFESTGKNPFVIARKAMEYSNVTNLLDIRETKTIGKARTIIEYGKIMDKIVHENGKFYSDLRPTDEWVNEYKRSIREQSAAWIRKKNKKIFVRDAARQFRSLEISEYDLQKRTGILVYGFKEDKDILRNIYSAVINNMASIKKLSASFNGNELSKRGLAFTVLQIAQGAEKSVVGEKGVGPKKTIYWEDFLKTKFFRKLETAAYIANELVGLGIDNMELRKMIVRDFEMDYTVVKEEIRKYHSNDFYIQDIYLSKNYIQEMLIPLEKFKAKHTPLCKLPLVEHLSWYSIINDPDEYIEYLKYKKVKLSTKFYLKSKEQLIYEKGVREILESIRTPKIEHNLLTYTFNQTENV